MVISDGLWKRAFGGDRNILSQTAKVNGLTVTILGVMPAGFAFPPGEVDPPELWFPQQVNPANPGGRSSHFQNVIGRLKPGVRIERARGIPAHHGGAGSEQESEHPFLRYEIPHTGGLSLP